MNFVSTRALKMRNKKKVSSSLELYGIESEGFLAFRNWVLHPGTQETLTRLLDRRRTVKESGNPHITKDNEMLPFIIDCVENPIERRKFKRYLDMLINIDDATYSSAYDVFFE